MIKTQGEGVQLIHTKDRLVGIKTQTASDFIYEMTEDLHIYTDHSLFDFPFLYKDNTYRLYVSNLKYSRKFPQSEEERHSGSYYYVDSKGNVYTVNPSGGHLEIYCPPNYEVHRFSYVTDRNQTAFTIFEDFTVGEEPDLYIVLTSNSGIRIWKNYSRYFDVSMDVPHELYFDGNKKYVIATDCHRISLIDLNQDVENYEGNVTNTKYITGEIKGVAIDLYGRYWVLSFDGEISIFNVVGKHLQLVDEKSVPMGEAWSISESATFDILVLSTKNWEASGGYIWTASSDYTHLLRASIGHSSRPWSQLFPVGDGSTWVFGWYSKPIQIWDLYTQEFFARETYVYPLKGDPGLARYKTWKNLSSNRQPLMDYLLGEIVT